MYLQDMLQVIDVMNREDAKIVISRARDRLKQIATDDPNFYVIQRNYNGRLQYVCQVPGVGAGDGTFTAPNALDHPGLRKFSVREWAEFECEIWAKKDTNYSYEVIAYPKSKK